MRQNKQPHILGTSADLLGICFILITGMRLTHQSLNTYADEITLSASFAFLLSCLFSYLSLRDTDAPEAERFETWADRLFLFGIFALFTAVVVFSTGIL